MTKYSLKKQRQNYNSFLNFVSKDLICILNYLGRLLLFSSSQMCSQTPVRLLFSSFFRSPPQRLNRSFVSRCNHTITQYLYFHHPRETDSLMIDSKKITLKAYACQWCDRQLMTFTVQFIQHRFNWTHSLSKCNSVKPTVSYLICKFLKKLLKNLLYTIYCMLSVVRLIVYTFNK